MLMIWYGTKTTCFIGFSNQMMSDYGMMEKSSLSARILEFDNSMLSRTVGPQFNTDCLGCVKKRNILLFDLRYFISDIFDDDVIGIYLDGIMIDYFGKKCALENNNGKKWTGTIIVIKRKLQIHNIALLYFNIACCSDGKNWQCNEKEKKLTI